MNNYVITRETAPDHRSYWSCRQPGCWRSLEPRSLSPLSTQPISGTHDHRPHRYRPRPQYRCSPAQRRLDYSQRYPRQANLSTNTQKLTSPGTPFGQSGHRLRIRRNSYSSHHSPRAQSLRLQSALHGRCPHQHPSRHASPRHPQTRSASSTWRPRIEAKPVLHYEMDDKVHKHGRTSC